MFVLYGSTVTFSANESYCITVLLLCMIQVSAKTWKTNVLAHLAS